ncbi:protein kinase domain-containing protein [Gimesia sp.]|uniref:protein kinase domain-containing protein n=1 Tax=Gimesia sp. TaxID=2024833 RepID=UPI003A950D39
MPLLPRVKTKRKSHSYFFRIRNKVRSVPLIESSRTISNGISGTPAYMSPEQTRGARLSEASDIFSLGLIFVEMLSGESLMRDMTALEIISALWRADFVESLTEKIPHEFRSDLIDLLAMAPDKRPTAKEMSRRMMELS